MIEMFEIGFQQVLTPSCLLLTLLGSIMGLVFGVIPGLTGSIALALCLPLTYSMSANQAFCLIMGIFIGGCSGGLISAILLNIPGTPSSIATTFDGYPMTLKGEAGKALGTGIFYSFLGGAFSFLVLFFIAPQIARVAVKFGPKEYFAITFFSLTLISSMAGKDLVKGIASGLIGVGLSFVGLSSVDGVARMTFGIRQLNGGIQLLPALIGMFAVSELIKSGNKSSEKMEGVKTNYKIKGFGFTWQEFKAQLGNMFRSMLIGTGIGILPGIGGITSNMLSYVASKNSSRYPEKYGTGIMDGIVASETANNASIGGAMVPLLSLGIPGDGFTAIVLGAFMIHGLNPGPMLMKTNANLVYCIFAALIVANLFTVVVEYFGIRLFVRMLSITKHILLSIVMVLSVVGAIGLNNRIFDAWTLLFFGGLGYVMGKLEIPSTPIILGFILGSTCETYLRRGLMQTQGSFLPFFKSPVCVIFLILAVLSLVLAPRVAKKASRA
jgi:putative tricarboxylic transport membrane protein